MTHEQMISARWFHQETLAKLFPGHDLRDKTTSGKAEGGYGMNVLNKLGTPERTAAARKLAHAVLGKEHDCPVCFS